MSSIETITSIAALRALTARIKQAGGTIGLVPTMGALHAGHLSLVESSLRATDETIPTIFVNPTQFAPGEDLDQYPRSLESDLAALEKLGVKYVFVPDNSEMYPDGCTTKIQPPVVAKKLEGEFRPHHFGGVATVVLKLLNLVQPNVAFFGQKDFQQVAVIQRMVADLNVPTRIEVCPIIRDEDGLAFSSRNVYLSDTEREIALSLHRTLDFVKEAIEEDLMDGFEMITEMRQRLIDAGVDSIDYAIIADPQTLETMDTIELPAVALLAVHVGKTRLIDNCLIQG
ncbi:MAG: pantoate--beta-alanine ligase [Planctomycetota bacterium]